jgi:hypothetical protein
MKNGKQTPSATTILRRVRRYLVGQWHNGRMNDDDRSVIPQAIRDVDICLSMCNKAWRDRF